MSPETAFGSSREDGPRPDFRKNFFEILEATEPIPEKDRTSEAQRFRVIGVRSLKRKVPVLLLSPNYYLPENHEKPLELFTIDPKKIAWGAPHYYLKQGLPKFLNVEEKDLTGTRVRGFVLEDTSGDKYLLLEEDDEPLMGFNSERFLDFLINYKITKIATRVSDRFIKGVPSYSHNIIIELDLVSREREDASLLEIAKRYKMTWAQFMRFRIRVISATDAIMKGGLEADLVAAKFDPTTLDKIAREIIDEDKQ